MCDDAHSRQPFSTPLLIAFNLNSIHESLRNVIPSRLFSFCFFFTELNGLVQCCDAQCFTTMLQSRSPTTSKRNIHAAKRQRKIFSPASFAYTIREFGCKKLSISVNREVAICFGVISVHNTFKDGGFSCRFCERELALKENKNQSVKIILSRRPPQYEEEYKLD